MIKTKCIFCGKEYEYDENNVKIIDPEYDSIYDSSKFCCKKCFYRHTAAKSFKTFRERNPGVSSPCHLPGVQDKVKKTVLERYGVEYMSQSKEVRKRAQETCMKKYGSKTPLENKEIYQKTHETNITNHDGKHYFSTEKSRELTAEGHRTEEFRAKARASFDVSQKRQEMKNKYGVENAFELDMFQEKAKQTLIKKTGYNNAMKNKETSKKAQETRIKLNLKNKDDFNKEYMLNNFIRSDDTFDLEKCAEYFGLTVYGANHFKDEFGIDTPCFVPPNNHKAQYELYEYIQSLTPYQVNFDDRKVFKGKKELDIYIPNLKMAFEFNGNYFHSENAGTPSNYHLEKHRMCEDQGIKLIDIWEYEWANNKDKIKLFIKSLFIPKEKIRASKCEIKLISNNDFMDFCNKYHLIGATNVGTRIGLYYEDKLVSAIGLNYSESKDTWELKRYVVGEYSIMGGFTKMFKYFIENYNPSKIITFVDKSKFNGSVNYENGFKFEKLLSPDFFWIKNGNKLDKYSAWRQYHIDGQKTSDYQDMMKNELKFLKCYDAGKERLVWTKE